MGLATSMTRTFFLGLVATAALVFSIVLASRNSSPAWAQSDDTAQIGASDSGEDDLNTADQQAHDAADAAEAALDQATQQRDQLESDGAPQDQIDEANDAVAQARAAKDAANEAAQQANDALSQTPGQ